MRIIIDTIPHSDQRYNTVGDYFQAEDALVINVSQLADRREMLLIAIHELVEWALCDVAGISNEAIDAFDLQYPESADQEPGDSISAPYRRQHLIASGVEKILAAEMGVNWLEYETHCQEAGRLE
jgi:hypothetical protein